jgi:hypothetical protein
MGIHLTIVCLPFSPGRLMANALGSRVKTIFIDEFHDLYAPHPERQQVWRKACQAIVQLPKQLAFVSATHPPHLDKVFLKRASIVINPDFPIHFIRASTDRPELAYYVLNLGRASLTRARVLWESTISLVRCLTKLLTPEERILIFFEGCKQADEFSSAVNCARYHSKLPTAGDTKAHNLDRWDRGDPPIMAATMAAGQGVDRPYVKFVLIHGHTFGMLPYAQQAGRAGRGGRPSYVILLRDPRACHRSEIRPPGEDASDTNCAAQFQNYAADGGTCRRKALLSIMDGELQVQGGGGSFAGCCLDKPGCNPCDVCDPESDMLKTVRAAVGLGAVVTPTASVHAAGGSGPLGRSDSLSRSSPSVISPQASTGGAGGSIHQRHLRPASVSRSLAPRSQPCLAGALAAPLSQLPEVTLTQARATATTGRRFRADGEEGGTLGLPRGGQPCEADFSGLRPIVDKVPAGGRCFGKVRVSLSPSSAVSYQVVDLLDKGAPAAAAQAAPAPEVDGAIGNLNATRSISQPVPSSRTFKLTRVSNVPPFSQPGPSSSASGSSGTVRDPGVGIAAREKWVREGRTARQEKSCALSGFLSTVEGHCPVHFVTSAGQLEKHATAASNGGSSFQSCPLGGSRDRFPFTKYLEFKKKFTFEPYTYCYYCGSPQDQNGRREAPVCHLRPGVGFGGKLCPWADFPFAVVFSIWHTKHFREEMMATFGLDKAMSDDEFAAWCNEEDAGAGEYFKLLEVFMWFCKKAFSLDS